CGLQNLVRPPQLTVLPLQFGDPLRVAGRGPGALPAIDLDLPDPGPQRLTVHAELVGHPGDRAGLHTGLFTQLKHHPDRAFTQLWGVLPRGCHGPSSFQASGPPPKPGRSTQPKPDETAAPRNTVHLSDATRRDPAEAADRALAPGAATPAESGRGPRALLATAGRLKPVAAAAS